MMPKSTVTDIKDLATDLTWIDMLKGIAIIGVFLDNWSIYYKVNFAGWGPFVHLFFVLSGFGLMLSYLNGRMNWNWKKWFWRRFTKVVVPYELAVILSFGLGLLGTFLYPALVEKEFTWSAFWAYATFTRNFFPETWGWNPPLWFMPIIIGLYLIFPLLIKILEKWGSLTLLIVSAMITYLTLAVFVFSGIYKGHQSDLFSFWTIQFALGMVLAHIREIQPDKLRYLVGFKAFLLGVGLLIFSWVLKSYVPLGRIFNDLFTSLSIFLILLNLGWLAQLWLPWVRQALNQLGRQSYYMYLIHYPILVFLIGPIFKGFTDPVIVTLLGLGYITVIFFLCNSISKPIDHLTVWVYRLLFPAYQRTHNTTSPKVAKKAQL